MLRKSLTFSPYEKDKILSGLIFFILDLLYKKEHPYNEDAATGKNKYIIIKRIIYIII